MHVAAGAAAADDTPMHNSTTIQSGAAVAAQKRHMADDAVQSPFAAEANWHKAREAVQKHVGLSQAFNTLRDMQRPDVIRPDQLKTIKILGQGAFARVDSCM
jgi:hypothetical protein